MVDEKTINLEIPTSMGMPQVGDKIEIQESEYSVLRFGDSTTVVRHEGDRKLGKFADELDALIKRLEDAKPTWKKDELIIQGMGVTRRLCPFDAETWAVNMGYVQVMQLNGHFTKIFMAHGQTKDSAGNELFFWEHYNKMAERGLEVWNTHKVKGLNSKFYPLNRLVKKYGCDYYSDAICYMLVWAMEKGYKKIRLYGIDMMTQEEYAWEKGGIEYWIGYMRGKGIEVWICEGSSLCKTITGKPYGVKYFKMSDIDTEGFLKKTKIKPYEGIAPTPWVSLGL